MKQILFIGARNDFPNGTFAYLQSLQQYEPVSVTGLFFSSFDDEAMQSVSRLPVIEPSLQLREKELQEVDATKTIFARQCALNHIKYRILENDGDWNENILAKESRFADLILISGELFYADINVHRPKRFLYEALLRAECAVLIVPENYTPFEHLFIGYDGTKESLYAMKQFCYLFPQYTDLPTELIYIKEEKSEEIPDIDKLKNYSRLHFDSMGFTKLHFKAADYFADWIGEKQHALLVSGSFGRSAFSYIAKQSFTEQVILDHKIPVFIAHS